jgi:hypothetical protein
MASAGLKFKDKLDGASKFLSWKVKQMIMDVVDNPTRRLVIKP